MCITMNHCKYNIKHTYKTLFDVQDTTHCQFMTPTIFFRRITNK